MKPTVYAYSLRGCQGENEDVFGTRVLNENTSFFVLADGMGGYAYGKEAATIVVQEIIHYVEHHLNEQPERLLPKALLQANQELKKAREKKRCKMGATVAVLFCNENRAFISWLGDVRIYFLSQGRLVKLTEDHVLKGNSHLVTRRISGRSFENPIPFKSVTFASFDRFLLCSDGFYTSSVNYQDDATVIEVAFI